MRGETIITIRTRHDAEIAAFRKRCRHRRIEKRVVEWAPGHVCKADVCMRCGMIVFEDARSPIMGTITASSGSGTAWIDLAHGIPSRSPRTKCQAPA